MHPTPFRNARAARSRGVTLIEMIIVISITAILAGVVAVFISRPVESYADAVRRAEITDIADTALRRMTRDLRTALPNSIRVAQVESPPASGNFIVYLEFLPMTAGGRYRSAKSITDTGDTLEFSAVDGSFDVIGPLPPAPTAGDWIVVYNLSAAAGTVANAYEGDNRRAYAGLTGSNVTLTTTLLPLPFASPGNRFQVVRRPVTYECNPATRQLRRYWDYLIQSGQPTPPGTGSNALLATDIAACTFTYAPGGASGRTGIVQIELRVERTVDTGTELIRLFQQVHVSNAP